MQDIYNNINSNMAYMVLYTILLPDEKNEHEQAYQKNANRQVDLEVDEDDLNNVFVWFAYKYLLMKVDQTFRLLRAVNSL